jgi:hypothetical protein
MVVMVDPFEQVEPEVYEGIEEEVEDIGRFLGEKVGMEVILK